MDIFSNFTMPTSTNVTRENKQNIATSNRPYKEDILDVFSKKIANSKDVKETVTMPRAIFKGYLSFTIGTTLSSLASMFKANVVTRSMNVLASFFTIYGTYNFVKPFIAKDDDKLTNDKK
jgi:hypothetical protein